MNFVEIKPKLEIQSKVTIFANESQNQNKVENEFEILEIMS